MHMWGQMLHKIGHPEFPVIITSKGLNLLANKDDHTLELVSYPYVGLDWRGCPNLFFTQDELPYERGNINIMFKLTELHFIILLNANEIYSNIF